MDKKEIAKEIKRIRVSMHITQQEFASKVGVTRQSVAKYETGKAVPPAHIWENIKALGIDARELVE